MFETRTIGSRRYHIHIPPSPPQQTVPAIITFHGSAGNWGAMARKWGLEPGMPAPPEVENYLLVFPEADANLGHIWMHYKGTGGVPQHDLLFVEQLVDELTTTQYPTAGAGFVSADPEKIYAAGFSNGGGMVWQLAYSDRVSLFRGFAVIGRGLDAEKVAAYQQAFGAPPAVPLMYIHGTADRSIGANVLDTPEPEYTETAYSVFQMLERNNMTQATVATSVQLVQNSTNCTDVVMQLFVGDEAFSYVAVINGDHSWPGPNSGGNPAAEHFHATRAIVEFWRAHAALP